MRLFNFHFKASSHQLKYRKSKNSPKYHNILICFSKFIFVVYNVAWETYLFGVKL